MDVFDNVDDKLFAFESLYLDIINEQAPIKKFHARGNQVPFMTEQWRKSIRHKNKLWKKFTYDRTDANYALYRKQRNKCTSLKAWTNDKCLPTKHHQTLFGEQTFYRLDTLFGAV